MKKNRSSPDHFGYFGIRLPFRSVSQLLQTIDELLVANVAGLVNYDALLVRLLDQDWFDESIFLASPSLQLARQRVRLESEALTPALRATLWRYVFRAYGRSTPYGLFAGVGTGTVGSAQAITFGNNPWRTTSRLDSTVLSAISQHLSTDDLIRTQLYYSLNNSVYKVAGEYRFSERAGEPGSPRIQLSSLPVTPDLQTLVEFMTDRLTVTFTELTALFGLEYQEDATGYIHALIDANFLTSSLSFPVTGTDITSYILTQLDTLSPVPPVTGQLRAVARLLAEEPVTSQMLTRSQQQIQNLLSSLKPDQLISEASQALIQTDLFFQPEQLSLSENAILTIAKQFTNLLPVLSITPQTPLSAFAQRFRERFDQQSVDLLVALDPQTGISLVQHDHAAYPLLSELPFPTAGPIVGQPADGLEDLRERLYSHFVLGKGYVVTLTDADVDSTSKRRPHKPLPPCWYLHGELLLITNEESKPAESMGSKADPDEPGSEYRFILSTSMGISPSFLFGRFCHGDSLLQASVEAMNRWEQTQYPDDILGEIVHLPVRPLRAGNVVMRPVLRRPEIPYLTPAGTPAADQVRLSDLSVRVSDTEEVILTHKPTGKRVRPRHTSAHNPQLGDEIYQFLSLVHTQEFDTWGWSWGALSSLPALPRIVYRNLIITPAQWTVKKDHFPPHALLTLDYLRSVVGLPRYVMLIESDNKLLLDLDFEPAQQILLEEIGKNSQLLLKEWVTHSHQSWVTDGEKSYVSELVIPIKSEVVPHLTNESVLVRSKEQIIATVQPTIKRTFPPGDEWLYLKVYLNENVADEILVAVVHPVKEQARQAGQIKSWFFIRYMDPNFHLRLRFRTGTDNYGALLGKFQQALRPSVDSGLIIRVEADTYDRELERYQPNLITDCETVFGADSDFVLSWLAQADEGDELQRYALATYSFNKLLDDFAFTLPQKIQFSQRLQQLFFQEQGGGKTMKQALNRLFREREGYFFDWTPFYQKIGLLRSEEIKLSLDVIRVHFSNGVADPAYISLVSGLVHMALNRIFRGQSRRHEMVVYHFMTRRYEKLLALSK